MKQTAKLVIAFSIMLIINGCTSLFWCTTPDVKEAEYDNTHKNSLLGESKKCYKNFLLAQKEIKQLRESNEVCK